MKKYFKLISTVSVLLLTLMLSGCSAYVSRYKLVASVRTNTSKEASLSFYSMEGSIVFKLKQKSDSGIMKYSMDLEGGSINVYYDNGNGKTPLSIVNGGNRSFSQIEVKKGTIYIIIETKEKCTNGNFKFNLE